MKLVTLAVASKETKADIFTQIPTDGVFGVDANGVETFLYRPQ